MELPENEIVSRVQNGETQFFGALYELYLKKIFVFIYYKTHHRETAQDLTSQTFMKALEKISTFDSGRGRFNSWIYGIARNSVTDHFRSFHFAKNIEDVWDLTTGEDVVRDVSNKIQLEEIRVGLQKLSPQQREIIILRVWQGLKFSEISEILGKSEAACKMEFSRGIKNLEKEVILVLLLVSLTF